MEPGYDKETLREMIKEVLREGLDERKGVFYDVLVEVLEDLALGRAIAEGEGSGPADRISFKALSARESAKRLAKLGGSERELEAIPRRRLGET